MPLRGKSFMKTCYKKVDEKNEVYYRHTILDNNEWRLSEYKDTIYEKVGILLRMMVIHIH